MSVDIVDWIRLTITPGIGCSAARKLLQAFGLPQQIFSAGLSALRQVVSEQQAQALRQIPDAQSKSLIERTTRWCAEPGNAIITLADRLYPAQLLEIADPPILLYVKGRPDLLSKPALAVVGSRNATTQGIVNAQRFSGNLSHIGLTIVSGLALGIDAAAHQGGLEGKGSTVAVIGTGIDKIYPPRNRELAQQIAQHGCIVSEYALGTPGIAANFPRRNRIISGLSRGLLVVEAAAQSGSLITARLAAEQGRDVFAIPGSIHSPLAKGCHQLIKQGAKLVETAQDILEELRLDQFDLSIDNAPAAETESTLLHLIGFDPIHVDELALRCNMETSALAAQLTMLELAGRIEALAGGIYQRIG